MIYEGARYDYAIVGAGSAGAAGGADRGRNRPCAQNPLVRLPRAWPLLARLKRRSWHHSVADRPGETWQRGRGLGGSSAVNGMVWCRGHPADYDGWARFGATGWGWDRIERAFMAIEDCQDAPDPCRGHGGPVAISRRVLSAPFHDAVLAAAAACGHPVLDGLNGATREGIGLCDHSVSLAGWRSDAGRAFLYARPPGLTVLTSSHVTRLLFDQGRVTGVAFRCGHGGTMRLLAREVILCAGAIGSPGLLQASGMGDAGLLCAAGIALRLHRPGIGANLAEHLVFAMPHRISGAPGHNRELRGWRLFANLLTHMRGRGTVMGYGASEIGGFLRSSPDADRPDIQIALSPYSFDYSARGLPRTETQPGLTVIGYLLHPESLGRIAPGGRITANWLTEEHDVRTAVAMIRQMRRLASAPPLAGLISAELFPGPSIDSDEDLLAAFQARVAPGLHATGSCRMEVASDPMSVVDSDLRVIGVDGLRVVDASVIPAPVSCNTNGPVMALAWAAADSILT